MRKVFETMGKLRQYVDAGSPNRKWNDTLALVETNKAALMIVGDWAKGDFAAANLKIDEDWGCALGAGQRRTPTSCRPTRSRSRRPTSRSRSRHSTSWRRC